LKKLNCEKNRLKFKKTDRFGFISLKLKKPNRTEKKPSQTEKKSSKTGLNQFLSKKTEPNRTKTGQFEPVSVFFFLSFDLITFFFDKNRIEPKIITPNINFLLSNAGKKCLSTFTLHKIINATRLWMFASF
jgi:hypothetical protein